MALKSAGSSPAFPIIQYNHYSYVVNHFNILNSKRLKSKKILYNKKTIKLVKVLHNYGIISYFTILKSSNSNQYINFSSPYYNNFTYFSSIRLVSTPSKAHYISLKALRLASKSIGASIIFLETSKGIITHNEALRLSVTGRILCIIL